MDAKIKNLLDDAINEVFNKMQTDLNIINGDISPNDEMRLETLKNELADTIETVIKNQK